MMINLLDGLIPGHLYKNDAMTLLYLGKSLIRCRSDNYDPNLNIFNMFSNEKTLFSSQSPLDYPPYFYSYHIYDSLIILKLAGTVDEINNESVFESDSLWNYLLSTATKLYSKNINYLSGFFGITFSNELPSPSSSRLKDALGKKIFNDINLSNLSSLIKDYTHQLIRIEPELVELNPEIYKSICEEERDESRKFGYNNKMADILRQLISFYLPNSDIENLKIGSPTIYNNIYDVK